MDALKVWKDIAASNTCLEAVNFYESIKDAMGFYEGIKVDRQSVLDQGSADFDEKFSNRADEANHYRAAYYMSREGYMNMHLRQNLAAYDKILMDLAESDQNIYFIDFGCGPMTCGLALADKFSRANPDYKETVHYFGIDISEHMCKYAEKINEEFEIFAKDRFHIVEELNAAFQQVENGAGVAILSLSFSLAPDTLKGSLDGESIAIKWLDFLSEKPGFSEFRTLYLNPWTKGRSNEKKGDYTLN